MLDFADEVWAPTAYVLQMMRSFFDVRGASLPHHIMRPYQTPWSLGQERWLEEAMRDAEAKRYAAGAGTRFLSVFDPLSVQRKNPLGVLDAFEIAFPLDEVQNGEWPGVELVFKTHTYESKNGLVLQRRQSSTLSKLPCPSRWQNFIGERRHIPP